LEEFGHSDQFLSEGHARRLWLPFLWGYRWDELSSFYDRCSSLARFLNSKAYADFDRECDQLWNSKFSWTSGRSLADHIQVQLSVRLTRDPPKRSSTSLEALSGDIRFILPDLVKQACEASTSNQPAEVWMHPLLAIGQALAFALLLREGLQSA